MTANCRNGAHTPGPWELYNGSSQWTARPCCVGAKEGHVATCEKPEDARLIAAAPDLLAALKDALLIMQLYAKSTGFNPLDATPESGIGKARAAIDKAEGRP